MMSMRTEKQGAPVLYLPSYAQYIQLHSIMFHVSDTKYTYTFRLCDGTRRTQ